MATKTKGTVRHYGRQAIVTRFHGPTNAIDGRVSATAHAGRVYVWWDDSLGIVENHEAACRKLAEKFGWLDHSDFVSGGTSNGYVWVAVPIGGCEP